MTTNVNSGINYLITNVKSGTAIDLSAGDNTTVTGWPVNGGTNQIWTLNWTGNSWTFRSVATGRYLAIQGTPADGLPIVGIDTPFEWHIWRDNANTNTFRIFVPFTVQNLDLYANGLSTPGDPITLWSTWNGIHQTWNFMQGMT
ncbi:ricin B-like lectin [Phlegmacium glaucopus]|nr:ricin B-like lectin [Phlegmacium glaucopus]